jgi:NAD(P)-dependent dehydrogenase (short-subunit alcohol dehydrogenase family)
MQAGQPGSQEDMDMGICDGRVAIVTGAGRGVGREHALLLAKEGAMVVVNDLGGTPSGEGADLSPAQQVVAEIEAMGGAAIANGDDVSSWDGAQRMVQQAIDTFGDLHVLVNNAGILRDRMLVNMTEAEWDAVIQVHLKGTFAPTRHAAAYWREQSKQGKEVDARVINTTSVSGIYGNPGQTNYGAAKMGIAAFTIIAAQELHRIGVTVNCISPGALTRLTENLMGEVNDELREKRGPQWIAPICAWLASPLSRKVTGRVFQVAGDDLAIAESWHKGPSGTNSLDPEALTPVVAELMAKARLNADMGGYDVEGPGRPGHGI